MTSATMPKSPDAHPAQGSSSPSDFAIRETNILESIRRSKQAGYSESGTWNKRQRKSIQGGQFCMVDVALFLEKVYRLSDLDEDGAIDAVYEFMDDCLLEGEFSICDAALEAANPDKMPHSVLVSFFIVTQRAKGKMEKGRKAFYKKAVDILSATHDQKYVQKLLRNYR
jgi:hypothetical protein